ncbi:pilus assembly protein TadG-related protein [Primorskyibacter sp. S87]|uniref:TadE/TadG family type IV pilus assembly protein n=1 Tax=Primorskyibacter sp. S87 TaxID=3415126 RepID=UPI003C798B11
MFRDFDRSNRRNASGNAEYADKIQLAWLTRFARDESGTFTVLSLFLFLIILAIGGIGVDLMRFERDRASLQYTMDRAVLAAADLDQRATPEDVVRSYLEKANLLQYLSNIEVTQNLGYRKVSATAETEIPTQFMHMSGVDTLTAPAASTAEESIGAVEISLVLDVSGSMRRYSRLDNLKVAAKEFVDTLLDSTEPGAVSISIIPYATQVNAGESLLDKYNATQEHDYSYCVNFNDNQFSKPDLERDEILERTMHFDPWSYEDGTIPIPVCPVRAGSDILPLTDNRIVLHNHIDAMSAQGNTSIDIGTKWGTVLLDPGTQSVVTDLIAEGEIDNKFEGRPSNYDADVLKIMVVMSDGQNTDQYMLNPSLREGMSDVWYNATSDRYTVYKSNGNPNYFWPETEEWTDHPYGDESEEPGNAVRLTYPELFNRASIRFFSDYLYQFTNSSWGRFSSAFSKKETSAKNQRTKHVCDAAKDEGIIVYTVAFEAPRTGYRTLKDCASSDSHVYDVEGLDIISAFESIASSIRKLRLTQ